MQATLPGGVPPGAPCDGTAASTAHVPVDAAAIAPGLGLTVERFRELMEHGRISTLSEKGTGEDEGTFRFTFYYRSERVRLLTDAAGNLLPGPTP
ncbi:DUF6522 family protein [Lysobacter sp. A3-1-A15]|uniref:DUF6522 family protein n=1 Tax=Novilysobacter viscosus TaxID=3098602 RepID=UPI002ED9EDD4